MSSILGICTYFSTFDPHCIEPTLLNATQTCLKFVVHISNSKNKFQIKEVQNEFLRLKGNLFC